MLTELSVAQSFALLRPPVRPASISGPLRRFYRPPRSLGSVAKGRWRRSKLKHERWRYPMTQSKPLTFPALLAFPNWRSHAKQPDSVPAEPVAFLGIAPMVTTKNQSTSRQKNTDQARGLFPNESEIARRLSQNPLEWPAKAIVLERHGLPRIDPLMGGRYWPAVQAYWHRRYGLSSIEVHQPDGKENCDAL